MKEKIPITSYCGNPKCKNTFTTQNHKEWPDKDTPKDKIIYIYFDGPSYSVSCLNCGCFTIFSPNRKAASQT